jgi:hypothetical protein
MGQELARRVYTGIGQESWITVVVSPSPGRARRDALEQQSRGDNDGAASTLRNAGDGSLSEVQRRRYAGR